MEDAVDIQPPSHVIDYWFDQLGLSLDPTSAGFLRPFPPLDGNHYVSSFRAPYVAWLPSEPRVIWHEFLTAFEQLASEATTIDTNSLGKHFTPSYESEERPAFVPVPLPSPLNQDK